MPNPRYDLYTGFHKLLRSHLFDASVRLGRADFASDGETEGVLAFVHETLELLIDHAAKEDLHLKRLLQAYSGPLAAELEASHALLDGELAVIGRLAAACVRLPATERLAHGAAIYARFNVLVARQLEHLAQEERDANAVLWANLSDRELAEIHQAVIQSSTPAQNAWLIERLLPVWNLRERAGMWHYTRANGPSSVAAKVRQIGQQVLGPVGWAHVERAADRLGGRP